MVNMERFQEPKKVPVHNHCSQFDSYIVKNLQVQLMLGVPLELYYGSARVQYFCCCLKLKVDRSVRCVGSTLQGWSVGALPPPSLTPKPSLLGRQVLVLVIFCGFVDSGAGDNDYWWHCCDWCLNRSSIDTCIELVIWWWALVHQTIDDFPFTQVVFMPFFWPTCPPSSSTGKPLLSHQYVGLVNRSCYNLHGKWKRLTTANGDWIGESPLAMTLVIAMVNWWL